jgi:transcriptional regulatory protein LevR
MIDNLLSGEKTREFENLENFKSIYSNEVNIVRKEFMILKDNYEVEISDNEIAYIVKLFIENNICV